MAHLIFGGEIEMSHQDGFDVAYEYTLRYFPRFFTWVQFNMHSDNSQRQGSGDMANRLTGPDGMGPFSRPTPPYQHKYSILQLDVYGNIFSTVLSANPPSNGGVFGFVQKDSYYDLPDGITRVELPYPFTTIAIQIGRAHV